MKIVIEGPNNVGKSTFISMLKSTEEFKDFEIEHVDSKCPNDYKFHEDLLKFEQNMIFDRFYIGETIYPILYNREPRMTPETLLKICKEFNNDTYIVVLDADYGFISRAYANKREDVDWDMVTNEKVMFENRYEILKNAGINIIKVKNHFDTEYRGELNAKEAIKILKEFYSNKRGK